MIACLAELASAPADAQGKQTLQWLRHVTVVLVEAMLSAEHSRLDPAAKAIYGAGLAVRKILARRDVPEEVLRVLTEPGPDAAPIDWQRHLGRWCEGADEQDAVAARIADIERAIAFLLDVRAPRPGRGGDEVEHELDDAPGQAPGENPAPASGGKSPGGGGAVPDLGGPSIQLVIPDEPDLRPLSAAGPRMISRRQAAAIRARRQGLPGVDRHPLQAVAACRALAEATGPVAAVLAVAVLSGEPTPLRDIRAVRSIGQVPEGSNDFYLALSPLAIVVPNRVQAILPGPYRGHAGRQVAAGIVVPIRQDAPCVAHLCAVAEEILRAGQAGGPLFTPEELARAESHLRGYRAPRRMTCAWLAGLQRQFCDSLCGGTVDLDLAVGAINDLGVRTRAHYRSVSANDAIALRLRLIEQVLAWLHNRKPVDHVHQVEQPGYLGSQLLPCPAEVRRWIGQLQDKIQAPPRGRPSLATAATFHNAFIAYSVLMLLWSTAARPTGAALDQLYRFESTLILEDKGRQGGARVGVLPPMAVAQRRAALERMDWMRGLVTEPAPDAWFIVDEEGRPHTLTVHWLMRAANAAFAPNAGRHAWINAMRRAGLREDRVALYVGHRALGSESGDPWSAANPAPTPRDLARIDQYLAKLGWRLISHPIGRRRRG